MNILKTLRKPHLSIFLASLMLFISCEQYETGNKLEENSFDYSQFNSFKTTNIDLDLKLIKKSGDSKANKMKAVINAVNKKMNTNIDLPSNALEMINDDAEMIFEKSLSNNWMNESEIKLTQTLISDIKLKGFEKAISNYEKKVLDLNLSASEFSKYNNIVNILRSQNYENPSLYNLKSENSGLLNKGLASNDWCDWCKCAAATVALTVATAGLTSCVTVAACGLAIVLVYAASNGFAAACLED